ncbi:hypothetical protein EON63_12625, partial [archaeon]
MSSTNPTPNPTLSTSPKPNFAAMRHIELPTNEKNNNLLRIRHSTAHVMAMAVQRLYPKVKVTIGMCICNHHHTTYTIYHTPYTIYHTPYTIYHIPYTIYHIPYTIYHIPYTIYHIPYT